MIISKNLFFLSNLLCPLLFFFVFLSPFRCFINISHSRLFFYFYLSNLFTLISSIPSAFIPYNFPSTSPSRFITPSPLLPSSLPFPIIASTPSFTLLLSFPLPSSIFSFFSFIPPACFRFYPIYILDYSVF